MNGWHLIFGQRTVLTCLLSVAMGGLVCAGDLPGGGKPIEFSNPAGGSVNTNLSSFGGDKDPALDLNIFPQANSHSAPSFSSMSPVPALSRPVILHHDDDTLDILSQPKQDGTLMTPEDAVRSYMAREFLKLPEFSGSHPGSSDSESLQGGQSDSGNHAANNHADSLNGFGFRNPNSSDTWDGLNLHDANSPFASSPDTPSVQAIPSPGTVDNSMDGLIDQPANLSEIFGLSKPDNGMPDSPQFGRVRDTRIEAFKKILNFEQPPSVASVPADGSASQGSVWSRPVSSLNGSSSQGGFDPIFGTINPTLAPSVPTAPQAPGAPVAPGQPIASGLTPAPSSPARDLLLQRSDFQAPQRRF